MIVRGFSSFLKIDHLFVYVYMWLDDNTIDAMLHCQLFPWLLSMLVVIAWKFVMSVGKEDGRGESKLFPTLVMSSSLTAYCLTALQCSCMTWLRSGTCLGSMPPWMLSGLSPPQSCLFFIDLNKASGCFVPLNDRLGLFSLTTCSQSLSRSGFLLAVCI